MRKRRYKSRNFAVKALAVLTALTVSLFICLYKMRPVIIRYAVNVAETKFLDSANEAVLEVLSEEGVSYNDIACLSRNEDGQVTSIVTDIVKINRLKSLIAKRLSAIIDSKEYYDLYIPIGTFFSTSYTNGYGPKLHFKLQLTGTAVVNFSHEFKSAGINQVLHIVMVDMDISGCLVTVGYADPIKVSTSAMAMQTLVVGGTPEAFTQVVEYEDDNTAGLINDYGAVAGK